MSDITCSFTGHREIFHIHSEKLPIILEEVITKLFKAGYSRFQSGGARGFDLLAAEVVVRLREKFPDIKLCMLLPCRDQAKRWRASERERYNSLLSLADEVVFLNETYTRFCMHERNRALVDSASVLITYLMRDYGGTAYTVKYAEAKGKKIINLSALLCL